MAWGVAQQLQQQQQQRQAGWPSSALAPQAQAQWQQQQQQILQQQQQLLQQQALQQQAAAQQAAVQQQQVYPGQAQQQAMQQSRMGALQPAAAGALQPVAAGALQPAAAMPAGGVPTSTLRYVVMARSAPEKDQAVIRTLIGEYAEQGENHGRRVYKKEGPEGVDVYMYYWDSRDGPAFQGWWFGNQVGGTQVWSHNANDGSNPPAAGWKIPWDGPVSPSVSVVPKVGASAAAAAAAGQAVTPAAVPPVPPPVPPPGSGMVVQPPSMQAAAPDGLDPSYYAAGGCRGRYAGMGGDPAAMMRQQQQEAMQKQKEEALARQKEAEAADMAAFEEFRPEAEQRANAAEDAVEKASITAEMINAAGEDAEEVQNAIAQTEVGVQEAHKVIGEARMFLNVKQAIVRRFKSQTAQAQANAIILQLQKQLQEAQTKLAPLRNARQDYEQKQIAQKLVAEVLDKLSPAELDVDRAEEATSAVSTSENPKDVMSQAEELTNKASNSVNEVLRMLESKMKAMQGRPREELVKLEERCKASLNRLSDVRGQLKEGLERVACETIVSEAASKLESVGQAVFKAAEAENPFLMGVEQLPIPDTRIAVKACETAVQAGNAAVSIARMFLATKSVEAKRFSKGPSVETLDKLKEFQERLDVHIKRLNELKTATARRKTDALMREAELEVSNAESVAKKVAEAAAPLEDEQSFFSLSAEDVRKASEAVMDAEEEAIAVLSAARKYITTRQIEAKGKETAPSMSSDLIKFQTRLSQSQTLVAKYKKLIMQTEQRVKAKQVIDEALVKITAAEEKVGSFADLVDSLIVVAPAKVEKKEDEDVKKEEDGDVKEEGGDKTVEALDEEVVKKAEVAATEAAAAIKVMMRFLETPRSVSGLKDEMIKLAPRTRAVQTRLDTSTITMKEKKERVQAQSIFKEAERRVVMAETNVNKVKDAEGPFLIEGERIAEDGSNALATLEAALSVAQTSAGSAKTFLAMKHLGVKKFEIQTLRESTASGLAALQARLSIVSKALLEAKSALADRKSVALRRDMVQIVDEIEAKVTAVAEAMKTLPATSTQPPPSADEIKAACERVGEFLTDAEVANKDAKAILEEAKVKEVQGQGGSAESLVQEITILQDRLTRFQSTLDGHKATVQDHQHLYDAQQLKLESSELVESAERTLEDAVEMAKQFTAENGTTMSGTVFASHISEFLKQYIQSKSTTVGDLFKEMVKGETGKAASEEDFVTLVSKLLEEGPAEEAFFTEDQLRTCFRQLLKEGSTELNEDDFKKSLHTCYVVKGTVLMTDQLMVKGGKTVKRLAVGETVEELEPPTKEPNVGILRLKGRSQEDGKEGWIALSGSGGTEYLRPFSFYDEQRGAIDQSFQKIKQVVQDAMTFLDEKLNNLRPFRSGPLNTIKADLQLFKPRLMKVQTSALELQKQVTQSEQRILEALEDQKRKRQEAAEKKVIAAIVEESSAAMTKLRSHTDAVLLAAETAARTGRTPVSDGADPVQVIDKFMKDLEAAGAAAAEAAALLTAKIEELKGNQKPAFVELKGKLTKEKASVFILDGRCSTCITTLAGVRKTLAEEALAEGLAAFRQHAKEAGKTAEDVLKELGATDGKDASAGAVRDTLVKIPSLSTKGPLLDIALQRYGENITKLTLLGMLQEYRRCIREIAVTSSFEIVKDTKPFRKLSVGELVQVLESGKPDTNAGLQRVRCRALIDGLEGWITVKGNAGTPFLEDAQKPYYKFFAGGKSTLMLQSDFEAKDAKDVRPAAPDEVFELLEGPKKEPPVEVQRMRVKAKKDNKMGFVTSVDPAGQETLEQIKLLVCKASIALTEAFSISGGRAIRKLTAGETMEPLGEERRDEDRGLRRIQVRTFVDKQEGWVTIKGNQGTAFVEPSDKLYTCKRALSLHTGFASGSDSRRTLEEGELVEVLGDPQPEVQEGTERAWGRSMTDGVAGWFTLVEDMQPWSPDPAGSTATACKA